MKIETDYDKDDEVFFMHENKITKDTIKRITIVVEQGSDPKVSYDLSATAHGNGSSMRKEEDELFSTKEELLKTL